jgi:Leucine-rich repeat (LRR) protein
MPCLVLLELPQSIGDLSSLEEMNVSDNKELKALPSTIGSLSKLKKLKAGEVANARCCNGGAEAG